MVTPCPFCGSASIRMVVKLHATQYVEIGPQSVLGTYAYTVTDENIVQGETEIIKLICCQCEQDWVPGEED